MIHQPKTWKTPEYYGHQHIVLLDEVPTIGVGRNAGRTEWCYSYRTHHMGEAVWFMSALAADKVWHHAVIQFEPEQGYHIRIQVKEFEFEAPL